MGSELYEFIWVEYYSSINKELLKKINHYASARSVCLDLKGEWHVGKCMNSGIASSNANHLILVDGDIAVTPRFLAEDIAIHRQYPATAVYYRRWDEPKPKYSGMTGMKTLEYLEANCRLTNPTNYGGCLTIDRTLMDRVGGYEEHSLFGGPGAVNLELYTRLRNAGIPILWHPEAKVYHPWHTGTVPSYRTDKINLQKEVINRRSINLDKISDYSEVEQYLENIKRVPNAKKNLFRKIFG